MSHPIKCVECGRAITDMQGVVLVNAISFDGKWSCEQHLLDMEAMFRLYAPAEHKPKPRYTVH